MLYSFHFNYLMQKKVKMVGNCKFNIRTDQVVIKLISGVSKRQYLAFQVEVDLITAVCIYKHNLKDLYFPSEYIVNIEIGTIYLKLYLMGLGQKVDFYNGKLLCKNVLQETGSTGCFCWALLKIKRLVRCFKKYFFFFLEYSFKRKKILAFIEKD